MRLLEFLAGSIFCFILFYVSLYAFPIDRWYEYKSITPVKPVWSIGEPLRLISTIRVNQAGTSIEFRDQLRCVTASGDSVIAIKVFPTALKGPEGVWRKTPWVWGVVPNGAPKDVPCYIRSVQKITTLFGVKRITEYTSATFTISDFDYTKQQATD